jgi:hypothetical protein
VSWEDPEAYQYVENLSPQRWAWEFLRRNPDYRADWKANPNSNELALKWGLKQMVNPAEADPIQLAFSPPTFGGAFIGERRVEITVPAGKLLYTFDLTCPLKPQIEKARQDLRLFQEMEQKIESIPAVQKPRHHVSKWAGYLRVLDAYEAGAALGGIAKILFPTVPNDYPEHKGSKKVEQQRRQAEKLVKGGYRNLLILV